GSPPERAIALVSAAAVTYLNIVFTGTPQARFKQTETSDERGAWFLGTAIGRSRSPAQSFTIVGRAYPGTRCCHQCDSRHPNSPPRTARTPLTIRSSASWNHGKTPCRGNRLRI